MHLWALTNSWGILWGCHNDLEGTIGIWDPGVKVPSVLNVWDTQYGTALP